MSATAILPASSNAALDPAASFDDDAWDDLLNHIEEKQVIPIIGPELLRVETDAGPRLLYDVLAEKLAARLNVDVGALPQPFNLNDVVSLFLATRGRREDAYSRLRTIIRELNFAVPPALRQLAQITDFNLFVTTTFDPLLEQAINAERFGGAPMAEVISYAPNRVADLPAENGAPARPVVYHLFGRLSASPTYVISDEDTLEFLCALQSKHLVPEKLFHELEHKHVLLIGSSFASWPTRMFLRMAKRRRLSEPRDVGEVVATNNGFEEERLRPFLLQVSVRTQLYAGAERFVAELHQRWMARRPAQPPVSASPLPVDSPPRLLPAETEMPDNAVFISYAREDLPVVQRLKAGFDAAGIATWLDMDRLNGGDDYDRKVRQNIARCTFFLPVISATTQRRHEAYFRREWSYAVDRSRNMIEDAVFILPVCIDDTPEGDALVPDKFKALHFTRLPGGTLSPEFARRLHELMAAKRQ